MRISFVLFWLFVFAGPARAEECRGEDTIPEIRLERFAEGFENPLAITHANDGSRRLFVVEQPGTIRVVENGRVVPEPLLDLRTKVTDGGERGLLGLAFHPRFKDNGLFYVNYTQKKNRLESYISEFRVDKKGRATPKSERVLLTFAQPYANHNGGHLAFGPDGYLYISVGDGGSGNDPQNHGQNPSTLLGTILRIDVEGIDKSTPYRVPHDNPFRGHPSFRPEIWAYGLRNPWRFSFDRFSGALYAADVGQNRVEEINIIRKGGNYGWRVMEGDICTPGVDPNCDATGFSPPIYTYGHDVGRSITGGFVYRGKDIPALCGTYLYGDFVSRALWGLRYHNGKIIAHKTLYQPKSMLSLAYDYLRDDGLLISTFGEDEAGELYVAAYQSGRIYRIMPAPQEH